MRDHAPAVLRIRSLARERATTRVLSGAAAGSGAGGAGSSSATRNAAPPAPRASNAAAHAPTGPPPTTTTSNMLERQTAGEPWRRAADAGADARQLQRIGAAPAGAHESPGPPTELALQARQVRGVIHRQELARLPGTARPDHREAAVVQGQHRERPAAREALVGDVPMRAIGCDIGDHGHLIVILDARPDPGERADLRVRAVGADQEPCGDPLALSTLSGHGQHRSVGVDRDLLRPCRHAQCEFRRAAEPLPERRPDGAVGDDITEGIDPLLGGIEPREPEAPRLRDVDDPDGGGFGSERAPAAEALEDAAARVAERGGALIEARLAAASEGCALDQEQPHSRTGERRGETRAHESAADDRDVDIEGRCGSWTGHAPGHALSRAP